VPPAVLLRRVTKTFGEKMAVRELDLAVEEGTIAGFIGPNGAGKTTTIRMILAILRPDSGEVSVLGAASAIEAKDRIGYLPEERGVYRRMRVGAFIAYMARLKGVRSDGLAAKIRAALERIGLGDCYGKRCEELSKGMQQKVQFLAAILHEPSLLILDEPFSGLDPVNARLLKELILEQKRRGTTILFSTHVMHQAEQICDHVLMIHRGVKVLDRSVRDLVDGFGSRTIAVEALGEGDLTSALGAIEGAARIERIERVYRVHLRDEAEPSRVIAAIASAAAVRRVELVRPTLEDVFIELAGTSAEEAEELA